MIRWLRLRRRLRADGSTQSMPNVGTATGNSRWCVGWATCEKRSQPRLRRDPRLFEGLNDFLAHFLGVAEQHHRVVAVEKLVFDAGVAGGHRALDEKDGLGALDVEDRHAVD